MRIFIWYHIYIRHIAHKECLIQIGFQTDRPVEFDTVYCNCLNFYITVSLVFENTFLKKFLLNYF
jgi:hypothetical protein